MKPIRIIGIGNPLAGDDSIGPRVIKQLAGHQSDWVDTIEAGLSGLNLLSLIDGAECVILIDATLSGQSSGTIHRLEIPADLETMKIQAWGSGSPSTHSFGLAESLILGYTLGMLPATVIVYGIELQQTRLGHPCSSVVTQAIATVTREVQKEIVMATSHIAGHLHPANHTHPSPVEGQIP